MMIEENFEWYCPDCQDAIYPTNELRKLRRSLPYRCDCGRILKLRTQTRLKKFRKKPVIVDAIQWTGHNTDLVMSFFKEHNQQAYYGIDYIAIPTLEGEMRASIGDWIIKGVKGEFYPCKPDIFEQTYEGIE